MTKLPKWYTAFLNYSQNSLELKCLSVNGVKLFGQPIDAELVLRHCKFVLDKLVAVRYLNPFTFHHNDICVFLQNTILLTSSMHKTLGESIYIDHGIIFPIPASTAAVYDILNGNNKSAHDQVIRLDVCIISVKGKLCFAWKYKFYVDC